MERQIIFRGKRKDNNEWVYGDLIHYSENDYRILPQNERNWDVLESGYEVIPETVSQYTGKDDCNGKCIFGGDILTCFLKANDDFGRFYFKKSLPLSVNGVIYYCKNKCSFYIKFEENKLSIVSVELGYYEEKFEVIGNIIDNPELINNKQN